MFGKPHMATCPKKESAMVWALPVDGAVPGFGLARWSCEV